MDLSWWGWMLAIIGLIVLCLYIVWKAFFYGVWLIKMVYSLIKKEPISPLPFEKQKARHGGAGQES